MSDFIIRVCSSDSFDVRGLSIDCVILACIIEVIDGVYVDFVRSDRCRKNLAHLSLFSTAKHSSPLFLYATSVNRDGPI